MSTTSILPRSTPRASSAQTPQQQLQAALNISAGTGRVLHVMCSQWSDGRISFRITVEKSQKLKIILE